MNNKKIKIFTVLIASILMFAVSCMENPSRPKRSSGGEEDFTINLGGGETVSVPINTGDYWEDNEKLNEIYSNQISKNYIFDGTPGDGLRYKFADNLDMVDPNNNNIVYKKYIKSVLVKVNDKDNTLVSSSLHGKYVSGGVYEVVKARGNDSINYNEDLEQNQPEVGGYEIIIYNYGISETVKVPHDINKYATLYYLYRYNLPASDANSNYDPEKVFDETYKRIGTQENEAHWFILPGQYAGK